MSKPSITQEVVMSKIFDIRGQKVMLSTDLAELYQVGTKVLNQQVKRNIRRFPDRYMFRLTSEEHKFLRSQFVTLEQGKYSKYPPYAFTEHGVLMLATVLRSKMAEKVNVLIIDTFVKMREMLLNHKDLIQELREIRNQVSDHDDQIKMIFEYLKQLEKIKHIELEQKGRKQIGFKNKGNK
jgi:phage regulator Rha-like protein